MSGCHSPLARHLLSMVSQKIGCSLLLLGAYTLIRSMSLSLCHLNLIASARPSMSSVVVKSFGATKAQFITKATPAEVLRFLGSSEFTIVSLFLKHLLTECRVSLSR